MECSNVLHAFALLAKAFLYAKMGQNHKKNLWFANFLRKEFRNGQEGVDHG